MKYIKLFESFQIEEPKTMSELLESLSVVEQSLLDSIKAEIIDIENFFGKKIPLNNIEYLVENKNFLELLKINGLTKDTIQFSDDYETFLINPIKYVTLRDKDKNDLQQPDYLLIQTFNSTEQDWNKIKMYGINGNFKNFYDKLSTRSIELNYNGKSYIYQTSIKNEWELSNDNGNETFPKSVRKEELLDIIKQHNPKVII